MDNPLVSICVPVFNGEKYLEEALRSILNQTYKHLEIVIVDDGSTDGSQDIVDKFALDDARIVSFRNRNNLGLVGNWNRCLELAKGDWIKFHFQDDLMKADTIEKMLRLALNLNVRLVLSNREYLFEDQIPEDLFDNLPLMEHVYKQDSMVRPDYALAMFNKIGIDLNFMGEPILGLMHRDILEDYGDYDKSLSQIVDFEYWLRIGINEPLGFVHEKLHTFRVHGSSAGASNTKKRIFDVILLDKSRFVDKLLNDPVYQNSILKESATDIKELASQMITQLVREKGLIVSFCYIRRYLTKYFVFTNENIRRGLKTDFTRLGWHIKNRFLKPFF